MTMPSFSPKGNKRLALNFAGPLSPALGLRESSPHSNETFESRSDRLMARMLSPEAREAASKIPFSGTYRRNSR